ncbi:MAG: WYL domain-containing protein [Coriobacteriia bacterium]|nr:WYL domain-containing protein [Coriobacteriia bacterium]MCL2870384.1 WYL domain-containing protein [Coriobacteriia bacterium]
MSSNVPEKLYILYILRVLKKYSDVNHRLNQKEIQGKLKSVYQVDISRSAIKNSLDALMNYHFKVRRDKHRIGKPSAWYYEHDFSSGELSMLINGFLSSSKSMAFDHCSEIVVRLKSNLASEHVKINYFLSKDQPENKQIILNFEELCEAIEVGCRVSFHYMRLGTDRTYSYSRNNQHGEPHVYRVSPYELIISNGRSYLICAQDNRDNLVHYRVDRMHEIKLLQNERVRPLADFPDVPLKKGRLDLPAYTKPLIYMYADKVVPVTFYADKISHPNIVGDVLDWFGGSAQFGEETEEGVNVVVKASQQAMEYWALQYGSAIEILEPVELREKIKDTINKMHEKYKD